MQPERRSIAVVETPEFIAATRKLLSEGERFALIDRLARHPTDGDLIPGTGGVRKLRWATQGHGQRGGARVIYFYHGADVPLFLLTAFAKNVQADLSQADRKELRGLTSALVARDRGRLQ